MSSAHTYDPCRAGLLCAFWGKLSGSLIPIWMFSHSTLPSKGYLGWPCSLPCWWRKQLWIGPDFSLILAPLNSLGWSQLDWPCWIQSYNSISTARRLPDFCLCTWCTGGGVGSNPSNTGSLWVTWSHSFDFSKTISLLWNGENLTDLVLVKHHDVEINYILIRFRCLEWANGWATFLPQMLL